MNHSHLPRSLVILLFFLVAGTFFMGTLRAFVPARAGIGMDDPAQKADLPTSTSIADFPTPGPTLTPTPTPLPASPLPPPTDAATFMATPPPTYTPEPTAIPTPVSYTHYADTTGIIALAILLVVVVLVGTLLGERKPRQKKEPKK